VPARRGGRCPAAVRGRRCGYPEPPTSLPAPGRAEVAAGGSLHPRPLRGRSCASLPLPALSARAPGGCCRRRGAGEARWARQPWRSGSGGAGLRREERPSRRDTPQSFSAAACRSDGASFRWGGGGCSGPCPAASRLPPPAACRHPGAREPRCCLRLPRDALYSLCYYLFNLNHCAAQEC